MQKILLCALALGIVPTIIHPAKTFAQGKCKGVVTVGNVTSTKTAKKKYEYSLQVKNLAAGVTTVWLTYTNFPNTVVLGGPETEQVKLEKGETKTIKFASGSNAKINMQTVDTFKDIAFSLRPYVLAGPCTVAAN